MTTPGSPGGSSNDAASKQGILSFFQNIKSKKNDIIEVVDSDDEKTTAGQKEPILAPQLQSWLKDSPEKNESLDTVKELKEVVVLPESAMNQKHKGKEQKEEKQKLKEEKETKKQRREEFKRQKELDKQLREAEKLKIENEKKAKEEEKLRRQKEQKQKLKEEKETKKQRREELKRQKEIDKQLREAEKLKIENEKKAKEEEKLRKESEKKAKEEAKERSQSRINNFFTKVADSNRPTFVQSDYEKFFLPFYSREGVVTSPLDQLSSTELNESRNRIDSLMSQKKPDDRVLQWLDSRRDSVKVSLPIAYQATSLLQQMTSKEKSDQELQSLLSLVPQKYIKFYENVRPPYMGTYSKDMILPVNDPFSTRDTGYNYDYDSDLEWAIEEEEEAEGGVENLESGEEEEEEEEEEESEGEFDGFLDPEDRDGGIEKKSRKRKFMGPLIPKVCLRRKPEQMDEDDRKYFDMVAIQYLIEEQPFPLNPRQLIEPRVEAANRTLVDSQNDLSISSTSEKKRKSLISEPGDLLRLFDEIQDSTFSLGTVTEIAQKNLPLYSKQIIKNTVKEYAMRTSLGTPRRWIIKNPQYLDQLRSDCNNIK